MKKHIVIIRSLWLGKIADYVEYVNIMSNNRQNEKGLLSSIRDNLVSYLEEGDVSNSSVFNRLDFHDSSFYKLELNSIMEELFKELNYYCDTSAIEDLLVTEELDMCILEVKPMGVRFTL